MLLVFLAKGDTFEPLGCRFGIGTETARRYVNEGIDALAALPPPPTLADALAAEALTTAEGELVFLGEVRVGSTHDLTVGRADGIIESASEQDVEITADSGCRDADGTVHTPDQAPQGQEPQRLGEAGQHRPCAPASPRRAALRPAQ
ncbi:transposase family protein [Streptomyces sp. XD-27]|nr:transposase family protein [Streptomyces sp. XD-27]WKX73756.1 transposase family protein [Streptomyces sp. XD-27]